MCRQHRVTGFYEFPYNKAARQAKKENVVIQEVLLHISLEMELNPYKKIKKQQISVYVFVNDFKTPLVAIYTCDHIHHIDHITDPICSSN